LIHTKSTVLSGNHAVNKIVDCIWSISWAILFRLSQRRVMLWFQWDTTMHNE